MSKQKNLMYWICTAWLALGMVSTGLVQVLNPQAEAASMASLGYPAYCLLLLGIWKLLGVIALLIPRFALLKEWAYAGFFFMMSGAVFSHLAAHDPVKELLPALLLLVLTVLSWYFRPAGRRITTPSY
ncbi:DoxX family protein [Hymenobacter cellulosivorans]|uniref:DoxX family protein n=1 Tax=Hymenobacter cellulosivorans TaxID=2932249 RepID=A0ABY4F6I1_9BACT|nr:DoxX family protein [Hymenobacter cellulosivorans]UOQ52267.1 DoxX family protein [Hymenobacter cellulosivorans]